MRIGLGPKGLVMAAAVGLLGSAVLLSSCSEDSSGPTRPPDTTPPAMTSLQIDLVTPTQIKFSWSAPGDDGLSGRAALYDLRYHTSEFALEAWNQATPAEGLEEPGFARSRQSIIIEDLTPGQTYFFALRTRDEVPNWSEPSPLVNVTMPPQEGAPVLWGGRISSDAGTEENAFIYQVREKLAAGTSASPGRVPSVVIDGVAHRMHLLSQSGSGDPTYEFDVMLPPGEYDYYFTMTNRAGLTSRLPSPDVFSGPTIARQRNFGIDFVAVDPDTFVMGNSAAADTLERPAREVVLTRGFYIDRFEITNAQVAEAFNWALSEGLIAVEEDTLVLNVASEHILLRLAPRRGEHKRGIQYAQATGFTPTPYREDLPATYVTWYGAALFCNVRSWLQGLAPAYDIATWESIPRRDPYSSEGWRLPTEAEWEYVAQYNDGRVFPTGNLVPRPGIEGNFADVVGAVTPVGQFPEGTNALGIRDLVGNVWEWCHDWKAPYDPSARIDPVQARARSSRIVRGGSWGSSTEELRCTKRFGLPPERSYDGLGFRCARTRP